MEDGIEGGKAEFSEAFGSSSSSQPIRVNPVHLRLKNPNAPRGHGEHRREERRGGWEAMVLVGWRFSAKRPFARASLFIFRALLSVSCFSSPCPR
jgi:hypothetical protein